MLHLVSRCLLQAESQEVRVTLVDYAQKEQQKESVPQEESLKLLMIGGIHVKLIKSSMSHGPVAPSLKLKTIISICSIVPKLKVELVLPQLVCVFSASRRTLCDVAEIVLRLGHPSWRAR